MTGGINDTKFVKCLVGTRIKKAREDLHYSRPDLVNRLNIIENRPVIRDKKDELTVERLKKWEIGENPVEIEWIPYLCKELKCDAGYLFGEYEESTRQISDACKTTGLSKEAIDKLRSYSPCRGSKAIGWYAHVNKMTIVNRVLLSAQFDDLISNMISYLCYGGAVPEYLPPVNEKLELDFMDENRDLIDDELQTLQDHQDYRVWLESQGAVVKMKKDVCKMYLQEACEDFRKIAEEVFEKIREEE